MSIKMKDIECKRSKIVKDYVFEVRLKNITNKNHVPLKKISPHELEEATSIMFHNLRQSILAYIYGDLIEPINLIAARAATTSMTAKEYDQFLKARAKISDILMGVDTVEEVKEASPIITLS